MADYVGIKKILNSDKNFIVLSDYLSIQERDRMAAILDQVLNDPGNQIQGKNYNDWAKIVRPAIIKELQDAKDYFGFKDLAQRFNTEAFLKAAYQLLAV